MKDGKSHHEYKFFGIEGASMAGARPAAPGKHTISYEFIPDTAKSGRSRESAQICDGRLNELKIHH